MTDDTKTPLIAVVGATGKQGGATARELLRAGARVRALVRDPEKPAAKELQALGAELVVADLRNADSLLAALTGADRVFAMTTPDDGGPEGEEADGVRIADAAAAAGVELLVYSSVGGAERSSGIPHFDSKRKVEQHIETLGLPAKFLRPTYFIDNFVWSMPAVEDGTVVVRIPVADGVPLQMVSVADIGRAASTVLLDPARLPGQSVELAGDERTGSEMAAAFGEWMGMPARYEALPVEVLGDGNHDLKAMYRWFERLPAYQADFAATRELTGGSTDLPGWLRTLPKPA